MESLSYACEGRALLFTDDTDYQVDSLVRNRNMLKKWDGEDAVENMGFMEPLLPNTLKNSFHSNQCLETSGDGTDDHSSKSLQSASNITLNSLMEFGKRFSGYVNKANDEKFATPRECNGNPLSMDNSALSSPEPSISAKRQRITNLQSTVPTCQVYGCNKDLSSSKDYHKRHKVCNAHSKTPVVIVNGIQQRFCQQCSRFHILAEFDEGKRSCRKRLAGHNERRRKPQFDTHLGSTYFTDVSKTSLIFSRILPSGFFGQQYNEPTNHSRILKSEEEPSQLSGLHFHGVEKQYPSKNCLNPPLSLQEFSWGSNSSCVLSLLSAQSQNLSSNSEGISVAPNLFTLQNSATPLGETVGSEIPETGFSQDPNNVMLKSYLSHEGTNTVDLLELSLHLQRVEQQKYFGQVKLENGVFYDSMIARK